MLARDLGLWHADLNPRFGARGELRYAVFYGHKISQFRYRSLKAAERAASRFNEYRLKPQNGD
jgi:hypothetical protein